MYKITHYNQNGEEVGSCQFRSLPQAPKDLKFLVRQGENIYLSEEGQIARYPNMFKRLKICFSKWKKYSV